MNNLLKSKGFKPLLRTYNEYDTACMLRLLAEQHENIGNTPKSLLRTLSFRPDDRKRRIENGLQKKRSVISIKQQEIHVLTQIPGIGRQMAKDLLTACGSLAKIVQTEDAVLMNVARIGKERLASIRQLFPQLAKSHRETATQEQK